MKTILSLAVLLFFVHSAKGQEKIAPGSFQFENRFTSERVRIESGSRVTIWFTRQGQSAVGSVLAFTDSSLTLSRLREPYRQVVPFRNILKIVPVVQTPKRQIVWVKLKNGVTIKGELIRTTRDSVSVMIWKSLQHIDLGASEIRSIRTRRKGAIGRGIGTGAGVGAVVGGVIGYASYSPPDCQGIIICIDFGPGFDTVVGAVLGAAVGTLIGTAVGTAAKEFKIEGEQSRFYLFADEFKDQGLQHKMK